MASPAPQKHAQPKAGRQKAKAAKVSDFGAKIYCRPDPDCALITHVAVLMRVLSSWAAVTLRVCALSASPRSRVADPHNEVGLWLRCGGGAEKWQKKRASACLPFPAICPPEEKGE